jgi:hypothetical protein
MEVREFIWLNGMLIHETQTLLPLSMLLKRFSLKFTGNFLNLMYNVSEQDNTCSNSLPPFKGMKV